MLITLSFLNTALFLIVPSLPKGYSQVHGKGSSPPVAYNQHKVIRAILQDLPFALEGIFSTDSGNC